MNATIRKFGYPDTSIREYDRWVVLLRPKQVTLGSLVLACRDPAGALSEISPQAFGELAEITRDVETALRSTFAYDRINYLLLMMVDPDVHFHVIPRYAKERAFSGMQFTDPAWPGPPDLSRSHDASSEVLAALKQHLVEIWPKGKG